MPLYQVCKVRCDFCPKEADILMKHTLDHKEDTSRESQFNEMLALLQQHGFIRKWTYYESDGLHYKTTMYACADPACREKLDAWSKE